MPKSAQKPTQSRPKVGPELSRPRVGPEFAQSWAKVVPKSARSSHFTREYVENILKCQLPCHANLWAQFMKLSPPSPKSTAVDPQLLYAESLQSRNGATCLDRHRGKLGVNYWLSTSTSNIDIHTLHSTLTFDKPSSLAIKYLNVQTHLSNHLDGAYASNANSNIYR